jgi:hypothetical protein
MSVKAITRKPAQGLLKGLLKYFPQWWKKLSPGQNSVSDGLPWIAFEAIDFLKKIVQPSMVVFEYGSGGSTVFWSDRVTKVVSVEHDKLWFEKMSSEFLKRKIKNVEYVLKEPEDEVNSSQRNFQNPKDYTSSGSIYAEKKFEGYVTVIERFADQSFDIIVVDGRARPSCILHSINKLKKGGYLIVDNSEREYYLSSFQFDKRKWSIWKFYGPVPYSFHFSETTIFLKNY